MTGQGAIIGTGAIGYPPEYAGLSAEAISNLGLSKVMTLTSTYDHRVIQGAESGAFLATIEKLLQGESGFYTRIFAELTIPQEPVTEGETRRAAAGGTETVAKQAGVIQLVRAFRVRGHLSAHLDPLGSPPLHQEELDLSFYGLSAWDLDRRFAAERSRAARRRARCGRRSTSCAIPTAATSASSSCTSRSCRSGAGSSSGWRRRGTRPRSTLTSRRGS